MKILCISDLHLEFERKAKHKFYIPKNINKEIDVLILAGDISTGANAFTGKYIDRWLRRNPNMHIIYVIGNHELYGKDLASVNENLLGSARKRKGTDGFERVHIFGTGNNWLRLGDYFFTGGTLWTDFNKSNPLSMMQAKNYMNDYKVIKGFTPEKSVELHHRTLKNISDNLSYKDIMLWSFPSLENMKKIVVTHHAPSFQSVPDRYKSSNMNHAYYSNLDDFILSKDIDLWVHGHTHDSFDYNIGKTRVYCNPRGYVGHELNPNFSLTPIEI